MTPLEWAGITWTQQAYVKASNTDSQDLFGHKVALSGNTLAVGAPEEWGGSTGANGNPSDNSVPFSGAAYVFVRSGSSWSQQAYLKASNTGNADLFGIALDLDGDTLVVGAHQEKSNATGVDGDQHNDTIGHAGAAYVFTRNGSTWTQQAYLKSSNTGFSDRFGRTVAIKGDDLFVAAPAESSNATGINQDQLDDSTPWAGAVYQFRRQDGQWRQVAYIKASNTDPEDAFGWSIALADDHVAISAPDEDSHHAGINAEQADNSAQGAGAVYLFAGLTHQPFRITAGLNDAWVSADAPYQGMFFTVFESIKLFFLSWFTFDSSLPGGNAMATFGARDQRWVTGSGIYSGNSVTLNMERTTGGIFNGSEPMASQQTGYGTLTIVFLSCNEAHATYEFPGQGLSGQMTLSRVVEDNVPLCQALSGQEPGY